MHQPVLPEKVLEYLNPQPNENAIDCTLGAAGHAMQILERTSPKGRLLGIDWDSTAILQAKENIQKASFGARTIFVEDNFANIKEIANEQKFAPIHCVLLDLGFSSLQIDEASRGFSFRKQGPLDLRYSADNQLTAAKIVNMWSKQELERILKEYGEEEFAGSIAKAIVQTRAAKELKTTKQLEEEMEKAVPA